MTGEPQLGKTMYWIKEYKGTYRLYSDSKTLATVQGSKFAGWRYALAGEEWSSSRHNTAKFAKTMAENALRYLADQQVPA